MPTPVSALIHAATMVTAGVYLLMRSSPLIEYSNIVLLLCLWLGAITTVFSSLIGLFQQDIKKIIAYSTMSQLGMMVIGIGLSSYNLALFHLINHAFYKALLFLGAGSVIHAVADNQDLRKYGGLINYLPLTYSVMLIASLSLAAFPFMTGFYSKDFILESAYGQFSFSGVAAYVIATIGAVFTTLYSIKVLYLTFLTNPNGSRAYYRLVIDNLFNNHKSYKPAHEGDFFLTSPLIILALFSIFFGFITKDLFIGLGSNFFVDNSLFIHPTHEIMIDTEFAVPVFFKLLPFICTISFSIIALTLSELLSELIIYFKLSRLGYNIFGFFNQRFLIEYFYNKYITNSILNLGGQFTKILDKGSIELFGPFGLEKGLIGLSKNVSSLSTGLPTTYALYMLIALILILWNIWLNYDLVIISIILLSIISENENDNENQNKNENEGAVYSISSSHNNPYSTTYIYNNKKMFSTSAPRFLNPSGSGNGNTENSSNSAGNSSGSVNGSNSNTGSEAEAKRQELINAMANRDEIGRRYINLNNEHSDFQDGDNEDLLEEAELVSSKKYVTKELHQADDKVAKLHKELKDLNGEDVPGAKDWSNNYPSERGSLAYTYFEENSDTPTTNTTAPNQSGSNTTHPAHSNSSETSSSPSIKEDSPKPKESFEEGENSNNKGYRSDSSEEEEYPSKRQKLNNNGEDDGGDDNNNDGQGGSNDGTGGDTEGGNPSDANNKRIIDLSRKDDLENDDFGCFLDLDLDDLEKLDEYGEPPYPGLLPPQDQEPFGPGEIIWETIDVILDLF